MSIYLNYDKTHLFGRKQGDGSKTALEEIIDQNAVIENDGRSTTRTMFYAEDANYDSPVIEQRYRWLAKLNDGVGEKGRFTANYNADVRRFIQTLGGHLELTAYQVDRVIYVMADLNLNTFGPYSYEKISMAVISLVANEDRRLIRDEPIFQTYLEDMYMDLDTLKRIRRMVVDRTDAFDM